MKHLFTKKYPKETQFLFEGVTKYYEFDKNLHEVAKELESRVQREYKKTLGDGFEVFTEGFLTLTENDNRFGISNYVPVPDSDDYGVDGYGLNIRGNKCAVQVKYKTNPTVYLTAGNDNLNSMVAEALHEGISYGDGNDYRHFVFTSAKGLNHKTDDNKFRNKVKCFGINDIKTITDTNINFWNNLRNLLK